MRLVFLIIASLFCTLIDFSAFFCSEILLFLKYAFVILVYRVITAYNKFRRHVAFLLDDRQAGESRIVAIEVYFSGGVEHPFKPETKQLIISLTGASCERGR